MPVFQIHLGVGVAKVPVRQISSGAGVTSVPAFAKKQPTQAPDYKLKKINVTTLNGAPFYADS